MHSVVRSLLIVLPASFSVVACAESVPLDEEPVAAEAPPAPQGESKWKQAARAATEAANEGDAGVSPPGEVPPDVDPSGPDGGASTPSTPVEPDSGAPPEVAPAPDARAPTPPPATSA